MSPEGLVGGSTNCPLGAQASSMSWAPAGRILLGPGIQVGVDCGFEGRHLAFVSFIECLIAFMLRPKERRSHYLLGNDGDVCAAPPLPGHPGGPNPLSMPSGSSQLMTTWSNRSSSNCTRKPLGWL